MSEDRNNGIGDSAVSDAYRDVATERAPASLNESVLRNAAAHASKGYAHSMLWMRPLAWAATVVLSVAIVVQVMMPAQIETDLPAASLPPMAGATEPVTDADLATADSGYRERSAEDDDPLKPLRDQEVREESKIEELAVPAVAAEAEPAAAELDERLYADLPAERAETNMQGVAQISSEADSLETAALRSASATQGASDIAAMRRVQTGDFAAAAALGASVEGSVCEPEDVEAPETWSDCIDRLEEAGRTDEATAERMLLMEAFPDFERPAE